MFKIIYDPTNHWHNKGVDLRHTVDLCRIPVIWAINGDWDSSLLGRIKSMYQFGWSPMDGFEIDGDGIMHFPGDPPLYPLLYIEQDTGKELDYLWFYHHDWISIFNRETRKYETVRID